VPSATYTKGKNQLELGLGFNLFDRPSQKLLSTEFNYKHFPNGLGNKYSMYFITRLAFINRSVDAFYPINYNYLFANAGYGFEVNPVGDFYMGTNLSLGMYSSSKNSDFYPAINSRPMFEAFGFNMAFQLNAGYRF
jgi:hypothetical protein